MPGKKNRHKILFQSMLPTWYSKSFSLRLCKRPELNRKMYMNFKDTQSSLHYFTSNRYLIQIQERNVPFLVSNRLHNRREITYYEYIILIRRVRIRVLFRVFLPLHSCYLHIISLSHLSPYPWTRQEGDELCNFKSAIYY